MSFVAKKIYEIALGLAVVFLFLYLFWWKSDKMAYVDSGKLLDSYKAMIQARSEFQKKETVWKANVDSLTMDVQNAIKRYEKTAASGSENERHLAKELINSKQKQLYDYQAAVKQNADQEQQRLTQGVLSNVNAYLLNFGKQHHYQIILIASNGNIAYANEGLDITNQVAEQLNEELLSSTSQKK